MSEKLLAKGSASKASVERLKKDVLKHSEIQEDERAYQISRKADETKTSLLFEPYRALGYYTSAVPFSLYKSD
jgi:hypothetical protein